MATRAGSLSAPITAARVTSSMGGSSRCMFDDHRTTCYAAPTMFDNHRTFPLNFLPSLVAALCFGAMFPIAASALHRVDPFPLTALRYGIAVFVFLGLLVAFEGRQALTGH